MIDALALAEQGMKDRAEIEQLKQDLALCSKTIDRCQVRMLRDGYGTKSG